MKRRLFKIFILSFLITLITTIFSMTAFAGKSSFLEHYDPDASTSLFYVYPIDECNRTVNVNFYDEGGTFVKKVTLHTKYGEDNSFHLGIGGYDIIGFSSNQGLWETCKIVWTSGSGHCRDSDLFVDYYFRTSLSTKTLDITVTLRKWDTIAFEVRHYVEKNPNSPMFDRTKYELYSVTNQTTLNYNDYFTTSKKTIVGYTLNSDYSASVSGKLCFETLVGSCANCPSSPRCYEYDLHQTDWGSDMGSYSTYSEAKDGPLDWCDNRIFWVEYFYDIKEYTVTYDANGGTGAPASQTKYFGIELTLSDEIPTREGYTFLGWSTSSSATSVTYNPGGRFIVNGARTLYAVWEENPETYTVKYNANGGYGAPASQTKTEDADLILSSVIPTLNGYTFKGWGTSVSSVSPSYNAGDTYTANAPITLYAIWIPSTPYTVSYNANGGTGAPASQSKTHGTTLYLSSTEPYRINYTFLGWSESSTATAPTYYPGSVYTSDSSVTLYAVWEYDPVIYKVYYNANGGSGAPSTQDKTHGIDITLASASPTRSGYTFKGWSDSSSAESVSYQPGDTYTSDATVTLYAVWELINYDFSISNLTVSDSAPYKHGQITVTVRTDNWDKVNSYSNIPVELYYGGNLVSTQYVNFNAYGVANLTFTLNVGSGIGNKTIEARVNWSNHLNETRTGNNTVSTTIEVKDYNYEMSVNIVTPSASYAAGTTVITSFTVNNDSVYDIIPSNRNNALFTAYYMNGSQKVVISTQRWENVVVPSGGTNLIYFKWNVPNDFVGKTVYCECKINADESINEENMSNNTATLSSVIISLDESQTPNTRYESQAPSGYSQVTAPLMTSDSATWTQWEYLNGGFVLKKYGVIISYDAPLITPDNNCTSAFYQNGKWTMKSGYGIEISYNPDIIAVGGYDLPDSSAYTEVQMVSAMFPEFMYSILNNEYRTLESEDGVFVFATNPNADENKRLHFIPVYVTDGDYIVAVKSTQVWTPVGVINAVRHSQPIIIDGSVFDDFYFGG